MCAPCKHKQQQAVRQLAMQKFATGSSINKIRTLENTEFLSLYYIGESNVDIPTLIPNVSYGFKEYGAFMYVAKDDYELHPELWSESLPS